MITLTGKNGIQEEAMERPQIKIHKRISEDIKKEGLKTQD